MIHMTSEKNILKEICMKFSVADSTVEQVEVGAMMEQKWFYFWNLEYPIFSSLYSTWSIFDCSSRFIMLINI